MTDDLTELADFLRKEAAVVGQYSSHMFDPKAAMIRKAADLLDRLQAAERACAEACDLAQENAKGWDAATHRAEEAEKDRGDLITDMQRLHDSLNTSERRVEEVEKALEPFAKVAEWVNHQFRSIVFVRHNNMLISTDLTADDFRQAAETLSRAPPDAEGAGL